MQFRNSEDTKDTEAFFNWLRDVANRLSKIAGVEHVEISQNNPFSFLTEENIKMHYPFQLDILYSNEENFHKANENFAVLSSTDPFLMEELIRVEPFCDMHICYIEKVLKPQKSAARKLFSWND
jgi:hypothetical protein